jgi:hypothetical protein
LPMRQESLRITEIEQIRETRRDTQKCRSNHSTPKEDASTSERMRKRTSTTPNCSTYQLSGGSTHSLRRKMRSYKKNTREQGSSNGRTESIKGDETLKNCRLGSKQ